MKETAPNVWSHKVAGMVQPCGSSRIGTDEILSSLLRLNNFDSISSIKDESLDIDLSACVTITPTAIVNSNSLSSSDFWRVLDESAQIPEKEDVTLSNVKDEIKEELPNCFTGTFLRPDPPALLISPKKRLTKNNRPILESKKEASCPGNRGHFAIDKIPALSVSPQSCILIKQEIQDSYSVKVEAVEDILQKSFIDKTNLVSLPRFSEFQVQKKNDLENKPQGLKANQNIDIIGSGLILSQAVDFNPGLGQTSTLILSPSSSAKDHEKNLGAQKQKMERNSQFKCTECEKVFEQEASFKKHQKSHRISADGRKDIWRKCPDCGKCLKLGSMWMHRKIHSDNRKYECHVCGQKFVQKINLTHHTRIHTSEKPFECPECHKRFQERSHLQRHQKYHAQTRSYRCDKCGKMYKTERCLKVHNLVHLDRRPFACTVCDKSFISNSKLKQHLNIHTGARPFKCNYCPRDFTNFPNWLKHTRRRHKVDHKTGEQLENIPSYCSKKSSAASKTTTNAQQTKMHAKEKANIKNSCHNVEKKSEFMFEIKNNGNCTNNKDSEMPEINSVNVGSPSKNYNITTDVSFKSKIKILPAHINYDNPLPSINVVDSFPNVLNSTKYSNPISGSNLSGIVVSSKSIKKNSFNFSKNVFIGVDDNAVKASPVINNAKDTKANISESTLSVVITPSFNSSISQEKQDQRFSNILSKSQSNTSKLYFANDIIQTQSSWASGQNITSNVTSSNIGAKAPTKRDRKQRLPKNVSSVNSDANFSVAIDHNLIAKTSTTKDVTISPLKLSPLKSSLSTNVSNKHILGSFLDLHCLSITSAEELIMEQALEMEECGLYDTPIPAVFN